jgi:hypothetical protein
MRQPWRRGLAWAAALQVRKLLTPAGLKEIVETVAEAVAF